MGAKYPPNHINACNGREISTVYIAYSPHILPGGRGGIFVKSDLDLWGQTLFLSSPLKVDLVESRERHRYHHFFSSNITWKGIK